MQLTNKQLQPLLKFSSKSSRPILKQAYVCNGTLEMTDIETYIKIPNVDLSDGLHDISIIHAVDRPNKLEDSDQWPTFPKGLNCTNYFLTTCKELESINKFSSKDETRPFLNGVYWANNHLVATDGYTMKICKDKPDNNNELGSILPSKAITQLVKMLKKFKLDKEDIRIYCNSEFLKFSCDYFSLTARLIQREYPRYQALIPDTNKAIEIDNLPSFKELKPLLNKFSQAVKLTSVNSIISLAIVGNEYLADSVGNGLIESEIGFNLQYLEKCLSESESNTLRYKTELTPMKLEDNNSIIILMPLKL